MPEDKLSYDKANFIFAQAKHALLFSVGVCCI